MAIIKPSELKAARVKQGLTQSKLAELAGVTQAYIAKIEAGEADPRISTLERISDALEQLSSKSPRTPVSRIMSSPVVSVKSSDKIERAVQLMETKNISQLPILDGNVQVGSISETSVVHMMAAGEDIGKLLKMGVGKIMGGVLPSVGSDASVDIVYKLLEQEPAALVIDRGNVVGIVTRSDLFKLRGRERIA